VPEAPRFKEPSSALTKIMPSELTYAEANSSRKAPSASAADLNAIYEAALTRYFIDRHGMVDAFVSRHFSLRGTLRIHRRALGLDILRAPVNLLLTVPTAALKFSAVLARKIGLPNSAHWLDTRNLFLETAVSRHITDLIEIELLGIDKDGLENPNRRDPLSEAMLVTPAIQVLLARAKAQGNEHGAHEFETRLRQALTAYGGARTAAGEITTAAVSLSVGAIVFHQMTPGMLTLGPSIAAVIAQQAAIEAFPLGEGPGFLWYSLFPVSASPGLVLGITIGLALLGAALAAFAGIVADPIQRRLGLHQRRLHHLLDVTQANLRGGTTSSLRVRDHYVARLLDALDYAGLALRMTRAG
jgi:hypothetical protein